MKIITRIRNAFRALRGLPPINCSQCQSAPGVHTQNTAWRPPK